eukprot:TRINITY_DN13339_c0_g1_i3.p1 TRINITY_DN13339_c0_g1~~TRINITY_DN13339_c0_g1_i3.p1  ORF type:complete len:187 (-),score=21.23 TRINITY_DN13339_c0_g1_i3:119-679(-)
MLGLSFETHTRTCLVATCMVVTVMHLLLSILVHPHIDWSQDIPFNRKILRATLGLCMGSVVFYLLAVLYGASLFDGGLDTLLWSCMMSSMCVVPGALLLGLKDRSAWANLYLGAASLTNPIECMCYGLTVGCVFGAWLGAIPIPLDWDRPWQVWPISCTYGGLIGYMIAGLVVTIRMQLTSSRPKR